MMLPSGEGLHQDSEEAARSTNLGGLEFSGRPEGQSLTGELELEAVSGLGGCCQVWVVRLVVGLAGEHRWGWGDAVHCKMWDLPTLGS